MVILNQLRARIGAGILFTVLTLLAGVQALAGAELILVDGRELAGKSVERRGHEFLLDTFEGARIAIPIRLVREIRLTGRTVVLCEHWDLDGQAFGTMTNQVDRSDGDGVSDATAPGSDDEQPKPVNSSPDDTSEFTEAGWRASSLSPTRTEQLAAFGRGPARFQPGPVSPTWDYDDVLGSETDVTQFNPSRWHRPPIDPRWRYEDELGYETDVTGVNPSRWSRPPIGIWWYPTDGWSRSAGVLDDD